MLEASFKLMSKDCQCPQTIDISWVILLSDQGEIKCPSIELISEEHTM